MDILKNIQQMLDGQAWASLFAAVAAVAALITALVNYGQSKIAARANTAQLYIEFSRRYNAPEIAESLMALADWKKRYGAEFAAEFHHRFLAQEPEALKLNLHRRTLNRYFLDAARAYKAGVLNKTFARLAIDHPGAAVFRQIVVPLNQAQYQDGSAEATLRVLIKLLPKFGEGEVF